MSAVAGKRSGQIHTLGFIFRTDVLPLTFVNVGANQSVPYVTQVAHALVSGRRTVAESVGVAGGAAQGTWQHAGVVIRHGTVQTGADVSARRVDANREAGASCVDEAFIHILTRKAVAEKTQLTGAEELPDKVGTVCICMACTLDGTFIYVQTLGAI